MAFPKKAFNGEWCVGKFRVFSNIWVVDEVSPMDEDKKPRLVEDDIKDTIKKNAEVLVRTKAHVGDLIHIINVKDCPRLNGTDGTVTKIDYLGQLHGTWASSVAIIPAEDEYEIILPAEIASPMSEIMKK